MSKIIFWCVHTVGSDINNNKLQLYMFHSTFDLKFVYACVLSSGQSLLSLLSKLQLYSHSIFTDVLLNCWQYYDYIIICFSFYSSTVSQHNYDMLSLDFYGLFMLSSKKKKKSLYNLNNLNLKSKELTIFPLGYLIHVLH